MTYLSLITLGIMIFFSKLSWAACVYKTGDRNTLICEDGELTRGRDNVFRPTKGRNTSPPLDSVHTQQTVLSSALTSSRGPALDPNASSSRGAASDPKASSSTIQHPAGAPYFRFALSGDSFSGGLGRCSATPIEESNLGISLNGFGEGMCAALTAAHCVKDAAFSLYEKLTENSNDSSATAGGACQSNNLICRGQNSRGLSAKITTSLPGETKETSAWIITPKNRDSDLAVIVLPCQSGMKKFKLSDGSQGPITRMQAHFPMSALHGRVPEKQFIGRTLSWNEGQSTYYSEDHRGGSYTFSQGFTGMSGDSGSPGFVQTANGPVLAGVLTGAVISGGGSHGGGTIMTVGLSLQGPLGSGRANLKQDVKGMIEGLACGN